MLGRNGGIIGPANTPSLLSAKGMWTLAEAQQAKKWGVWPVFALPSKTWISGALQDSNNLSTYTFTGASLSMPHFSRRIALVMAGRMAGGNALSSFSVAGISGSILTQVTSAAIVAAVGIVAVPEGLTGDIVVTFNGTMEVCAVSRYAVYDLNSSTAVHTVTSISQSATLNVNTSADGIVIAGGMNNPGASASCSGVTEDLDTALAESGRNFYSASASGAVVATPRSVSISWSTAADMAAVAVSLR